MTAVDLGLRTVAQAHAVWRAPVVARFRSALLAVVAMLTLLALASWNPADPSLNAASGLAPSNWLGTQGATLADLVMQALGLAAWPAALLLLAFGTARALAGAVSSRLNAGTGRVQAAAGGVVALAAALSALAAPAAWPIAAGLGGLAGDVLVWAVSTAVSSLGLAGGRLVAGLIAAPLALGLLAFALGLTLQDVGETMAWLRRGAAARPAASSAATAKRPGRSRARTTTAETPVRTAAPVSGRALDRAFADDAPDVGDDDTPPWDAPAPAAAARGAPPAAGEPRVAAIKAPKPARKDVDDAQQTFDFARPSTGFDLPPLAMLAKPTRRVGSVDEAALKANARMLEGVLQEFGVRGVIDQIRPGPVVTLYELVPAPGIKHGRVVALADDIARSMSARACRISVVQGRNAIGIELPNAKRETVYLRDLLASSEYARPGHLLPLALGETIGGEPYVADLARMPHLLIAGTTGSGKSVGVNAMILSILYRHSPAECRFIMIDPKMLELSVYDGIPHLLAPVVTDPKKAVVALKWTVREMEDRYRRMSKLGVRNIASYNERAREALAKGEHFERTVQTGFDEQGRPVYESEKIRPEPMPYLVVVMDEMADLMLVAGKDVEGAVQRLAQMARAAGIHLVMATQRPSVDVITGTIKANFPTRISFQVTSRIDSRTILGEQGGEQLLGQGDMLYMAGGGRITRLHGPFVTDQEVEEVCKHLRSQGEPEYLEAITDGGDDEEGGGVGEFGGGGDGSEDLYDRAVAVVTRDRKASTSYVQRRLQIGYNRAASLIERMEQEGVVSPANHAGKRDVLAGPPP